MQSTKKRNNVIIQGSILAAASLIVRLIGLIYRIPMMRIIGSSGMGYYNFAFEVYNLALILSSYSLPLAVSKLVASRNINREYRNSYRVFRCAMIFAISVGLLTSLVIFFGAEQFAILVSNDPKVAIPLRLLAPTIFVFSIMGVLRGFFQGKSTMIPTSISQIIEQIVNAVVSILAAYFLMEHFRSSLDSSYYGAAGGTLGTLIGAVSGLLFLVFVFYAYQPILKKQTRKDTTTHLESYPSIMKLIVLTIAPIILSQTVYHVSGFIDGALFAHILSTNDITHFDQIEMAFRQIAVPGSLYTSEQISALYGVYGVEYRLLSNVPVAIASAFGAAIVPTLASATLKQRVGEVHSKIHATIKLNMIIAIPSAVGMGVLSSPILQLLFSDDSTFSANLLRLGSVAVVFFALSTVTNGVLQGIGKLHIPVIHSAISLGLHVILIYVLLKHAQLSTYGLVIGNVTFALVICILNWIAIERYLNYHQEIKKTFLIPLLSASVMGVVAFFTHQGIMLWTKSNIISTILSIIVAVIVYFLLLVLFRGVGEEELKNFPKGKAIIKLFRRFHLL